MATSLSSNALNPDHNVNRIKEHLNWLPELIAYITGGPYLSDNLNAPIKPSRQQKLVTHSG